MPACSALLEYVVLTARRPLPEILARAARDVIGRNPAEPEAERAAYGRATSL